MPDDVKRREDRARREAMWQGYMLVKSRRRDPRAEDYGLYVLVGDTTGNRAGRRGGQAAISAFYKGEGMTLAQPSRGLPRHRHHVDVEHDQRLPVVEHEGSDLGWRPTPRSTQVAVSVVIYESP